MHLAGFIGYVQAVTRNVGSRKRGALLKFYLLLMGCKVGKNLKCAGWPYFVGFPHRNIFIGNNVDLGRNLTIELTKKGKLIIEDQVLFHQNILISCNHQITFKKWSGVAENVSIRDGNHTFKANSYFRLQETVSAPVEVGEGAGIGAGCIVLMGANIAKGAFIGANSLVTKKSVIEENGIYAGNPLKFIAKRN